MKLFSKQQYKKWIRKVYFGLFDSWVFDSLNSRYFRSYFQANRQELTKTCQVVEALEGEKVLILAPHCDDEVIGCGGAILSYLESGKEVFIAYMTNGQKQGSQANAREVIEERQREAYSVAETLGIPKANLFFLGGTDGDLLHSPVEEVLGEILRRVQPDTVFLPITLDNHADHYATSKKLLGAGEFAPEVLLGVRLYLYESQSPLTLQYANTCLRITEHSKRKEELLKLFKSQPYPFKFIKNLNQMNGGFLGAGEVCETYLRVGFTEFKAFILRYFAEDAKYFELKARLLPNKHSASLITSYRTSAQEKGILKDLSHI